MKYKRIGILMKKDYEKLGLKISMAGSVLLSASAIIMAIIAKSQAVLLDGLYTFTTLIMSFISLKVIDLIKIPETRNRPFGYTAFEPFINLIKCIIILTLLLIFLVSNIQELCRGGRMISLDLITIYIFIILVIYFSIIFIIKKCGKKTDSSILKLEIQNWTIDAFLTLGIAISLVIAIIIYSMGYIAILPYVDPVIVILLIIVSLPPPLKILITEFKRLLLISDDNRLEHEVTDQLQPIIKKYKITKIQVWALNSSRNLYLYIYMDLKDENLSISKADRIRKEIFIELSKIYTQFWADIMFTRIDPEKTNISQLNIDISS